MQRTFVFCPSNTSEQNTVLVYLNNNIANLINRFTGNGDVFNHDCEADPIKITYLPKTISSKCKSCEDCKEPIGNEEHFSAMKNKYRCLIDLPLRYNTSQEKKSAIGHIHFIAEYDSYFYVEMKLKEPHTAKMIYRHMREVSMEEYMERHMAGDWRIKKYPIEREEVEIFWEEKWIPLVWIFDPIAPWFLLESHLPIKVHERPIQRGRGDNIQWPTGATMASGPIGLVGPRGPTMISGPIGPTGPTGFPGLIGSRGITFTSA